MLFHSLLNCTYICTSMLRCKTYFWCQRDLRCDSSSALKDPGLGWSLFCVSIHVICPPDLMSRNHVPTICLGREPWALLHFHWRQCENESFVWQYPLKRKCAKIKSAGKSTTHAIANSIWSRKSLLLTFQWKYNKFYNEQIYNMTLQHMIDYPPHTLFMWQYGQFWVQLK